MSLMNASIHNGHGVFSIDTCLSIQLDDKGNPLKNCELTAEKAQAAGHPPAVPLGRATKLISLPHMQAVAGSNGSLVLISLIHGAMPNLSCADINDFPNAAPKVFRLARKQASEMLGQEIERAGISSAIVGFSPGRKAVIGWHFTHLDDFEIHPLPFGASRTAINPNIHGGDPQVKKLRGLINTADASIEAARRMHIEIASNQFRTYKSGKYPPGYHCSNELHIATVTEKEINISREFLS